MTRESLARISAWCIALYAFDVMKPAVDIFRLPVPRSVASMTLSTPLIIASLGILIYIARRKNKPILSGTEITLSGVLIFWAGLEFIGASGRSVMSFDMVLGFLPLLLALIASHLHLKLFCDKSILVSAMLFSAGLIVFIHTILLLIVSIGVQPSIIEIDEINGRNAIAMFIPVCLWMLAWFPLKHWPAFGRRFNLLVLIAITNALLNSGRMALLVMMWCVLVGAVLHMPIIRQLLRLLLLPASIVLIVVVSFSYPIVLALNEYGVWGLGDDLVSILSRSKANYLLLNKLEQDSLLGIGWTEVAATRAFGYMGHSLYVNILSAYGFIGAFAAVFALGFGLLRVHEGNREAATHLLFFTILITSFVNDVFGYFGVLIALIGVSKATNIYKYQRYALK